MDDNLRVKKTVLNPPFDIISSLPWNVIDTILTCLPLRDAVRTSILSSKWRYYWVNISKLSFEDSLFPGFEEDDSESRYKFTMIVYRTLLRHRGSILKFKLSVHLSEFYSEIDQWIPFLSSNGVREFTLDCSSCDGRYQLPSSFFSCLHLTHLNLERCALTLPPGFDGFSNLVSLVFRRVEFHDDVFVGLISKSPFLESIILDSNCYFGYIEFDAPVLKSVTLWIDVDFSSIRFKNTPLLEFLSIGLESDVENILEKGKTSKMIETFDGIRALEQLHLTGSICEILSYGGVPHKLPFIMNELKFIELDYVSFDEVDKVSVVLCLLKSSPNLEKLKIKAFTETGRDVETAVDLLETQHHTDISLNRLRQVWIWLTSASLQDLGFIQLILAKSPNLLEMFVDSNVHESKISKVLNRYKRASPNAQVILTS